jgi:hypothetical protein
MAGIILVSGARRQGEDAQKETAPGSLPAPSPDAVPRGAASVT